MPETTRSLQAGEQVGNYQILGLVGAGGMGVVYRAKDRKLDRTVALKFLPHELTVGEKDKERFLREAKSASALDHTNIGVIHGLEEDSAGRLFIVMAYYEGETLAQRIHRAPMPPSEAVDIAVQIARGLAEAHARNIIHRDIKPSNIILTAQGVAKIVDFGLARVVATPSITQSGGTTGTVAYMSPEQTLGKPVDQRTDVWALGVVFAEMLTGQNPFTRDTVPNIIFSILNQPPSLGEEIPPELQPIRYRALAKDPANRYPGCKELLADLQALPKFADQAIADAAPTRSIRSKDFQKYVEHASTPSWPHAVAKKPVGRWWLFSAAALAILAAVLYLIPSTRERIAGALFAGNEKHIAVLPFDNIGNDPGNEVLAQGLMDSLSSRLSNLEVGQQSLWVVPASVVRARKVDDPTAALRVLGATLVVKGSIAREGQDVQLTVNLINAKTLRQIGSVALEDRAGDIATLQDEAVSRLSKLMGISVTPEMLRATGGKVNPAAYESYLKALGYLQRWDKPGNLDLAFSALNDAVKSDPQFALAYAELANANRLQFAMNPDPKLIDEAVANGRRAADLDNHLPAVYVTLARTHVMQTNFDLALQEFQHALQLDPHDADALGGLAGTYERMGRASEAEVTYKKTITLRPDYWDGYNNLGLFYVRQRRFPEAISQFQHVLELTPDNPTAYSNLGLTYLALEKLPDAESAFKKSIDLSPSYFALANLGVLYYNEKRYADSASLTEKALALNDKDYRVWSNLMATYQWLKDDAKAAQARERELALVEDHVKGQPRDAVAQSELADLYAAQKRRDKAVTCIQTALALAPDDVRVLRNVGSAYEVLGDRPNGLRYVELALGKGTPLDELQSDPDLQSLLKDPKFRPKGK